MGRKLYEQMEVVAKDGDLGRFMKLFEGKDYSWMRLIQTRPSGKQTRPEVFINKAEK